MSFSMCKNVLYHYSNKLGLSVYAWMVFACVLRVKYMKMIWVLLRAQLLFKRKKRTKKKIDNNNNGWQTQWNHQPTTPSVVNFTLAVAIVFVVFVVTAYTYYNQFFSSSSSEHLIIIINGTIDFSPVSRVTHVKSNSNGPNDDNGNRYFLMRFCVCIFLEWAMTTKILI